MLKNVYSPLKQCKTMFAKFSSGLTTYEIAADRFRRKPIAKDLAGIITVVILCLLSSYTRI